MSELTRAQLFELIERNIRERGFHMHIVAGGVVPRFAYTIGLTASTGAELVLAGAILYTRDDLVGILHAAREKLARDRSASELEVSGLGRFSLRAVHPSWVTLLLLGAVDFYRDNEVRALQVIPDDAHRTSDVPDLSREWSPGGEPAWQWLRLPWPHEVPRESTATTNLSALLGQPITEVCRWGEGEWEMFAGAGPDVAEEDVRVVPLGSLLTTDPSLTSALTLAVGEGLWREGANAEWHAWGPSSAAEPAGS